MSRVEKGWRRALTQALALVLACGGAHGCDQFDTPVDARPAAAESAADRARGAARETMTTAMKAAQATAASCAAGDLRWEADVDGNVVPRHFSRPCIPERCAPTPAEIEALRAGARAVRSLVDGDPNLHVPSFQGFVALAEAMVGFTDTALAGSAGTATASEKPLRLSGLSMHYGSLSAAFREIYPDSDIPLEPPSLVASLAVAEPGGDPCKGWALPQYCDVRGVRVPKERKWRTDPPCIEVESVRK